MAKVDVGESCSLCGQFVKRGEWDMADADCDDVAFSCDDLLYGFTCEDWMVLMDSNVTLARWRDV